MPFLLPNQQRQNIVLMQLVVNAKIFSGVNLMTDVCLMASGPA